VAIVPGLTLALVYVQLKAEGDIYEDVGEDEYQEIVKKRREDEFIEDDGASACGSSIAPLVWLWARRITRALTAWQMVPATWTLDRKTGTTRRTRATRRTPTSVPRRRAPRAAVSSTTFS